MSSLTSSLASSSSSAAPHTSSLFKKDFGSKAKWITVGYFYASLQNISVPESLLQDGWKYPAVLFKKPSVKGIWRLFYCEEEKCSKLTESVRRFIAGIGCMAERHTISQFLSLTLLLNRNRSSYYSSSKINT